MIECTSSADTLARQAFGKDNVAISNIKSMMERFKLDPATSPVAREAFVVTDMDLTRKNKDAFLQAAASKHPNVVIVYIARKGKSDVKEGNGINAVLEKPSEEKLADTVFGIVEEISKKERVAVDEDSNANIPEDFGENLENTDVLTDEFGNPLEFDYADDDQEQATDEQQDEEPTDILLDEEPEGEDIPEPEPALETEQSLIDRLNACNKVTEIAEFTRELDAAAVIKDVMKSQADYTGIEERIKGINEKINAVYLDTSIPTQEKLDKVRALIYDKNYYRSKTNTILEQRIEELIDTITSKTQQFVNERCKELDRIIANCAATEDTVEYSSRISGLLDERSNIMLELTAIQLEIQDIYANMDKAAKGITTEIVKDSTSETGSRLVDERLTMLGHSVVPDQTVDVVQSILSSVDQKSSVFTATKNQLIVMNQKLIKLMSLDQELIDALTKTVEILKANNVEEMVYADTLIKKALRVFVGQPGSGKTIIPYVCSKLKSRQNCNVLYIDITGSCRLQCYGEESRDINDWLNNQYREECCIVAGTIPNTPEAAQRLLVALTKAADYYKVINVVMTPEQKVIFDVIVPDILCVDYIVNAETSDLDFYYQFIRDTHYENVAQRIIINKSIPNTLNIILNKLGVIKDLDVHVVSIPHEPVIVECGLRAVKPYEVQAVTEAFREVCKVC